MGATMEVRYVLPSIRTPLFATAKMANFIYWVLAHTTLHYPFGGNLLKPGSLYPFGGNLLKPGSLYFQPTTDRPPTADR
jgi:hypothetical protein